MFAPDKSPVDSRKTGPYTHRCSSSRVRVAELADALG